MDLGEHLLLFDMPSKVHLKKAYLDILYQAISGRDVWAIFSHGHEDHFNPEIVDDIKDIVSSYNLFISYDIYNLDPSKFSKNTFVLEPEEEYEIEDVFIKTYESNDEGNAYLFKIKGVKIYFGGDLAEWVWPGMSEEAVRFTISYFEEILDELREENIDIGFSNVDPRLTNLGGGIKFLKRVRPKYFIPMHTFGKYAHFKKLEPLKKEMDSQIFIYSKSGDWIEIEV
jgi:L-ascorbate metabolism protein UlaG (beta-lactamase superfamily)